MIWSFGGKIHRSHGFVISNFISKILGPNLWPRLDNLVAGERALDKPTHISFLCCCPVTGMLTMWKQRWRVIVIGESILVKRVTKKCMQWGIQDFSEGCGNLLFGYIFTNQCVKWKDLDQGGGGWGHASLVPLGSGIGMVRGEILLQFGR